MTWTVSTRESHRSIVVEDEHGLPVATVAGHLWGDEDCMAKGLKIAAAPELLDFARLFLVTQFGKWEDETDAHWHDRLHDLLVVLAKDAEAAVKKATGRIPQADPEAVEVLDSIIDNPDFRALLEKEATGRNLVGLARDARLVIDNARRAR